MNIDQYKLNKSNLRIAPDNCSPLLSSSFHNLTLDTNNNNNDNNETNRYDNNRYKGSRNLNSPSGILPSTPHINTQNNTSHKFAKATSSPSLDDTSHTISIATLNVRGFASNVFKFNAIIDDLFNKDLSIIGIQETYITEQSANILFKNRCAMWSKEYPYRAYWDYNPADHYSGVGLIVKPFVSTYVQKVTRHQERYISLDLYLPARKLKIINIYNHQKINWLASHSNRRMCGHTFTNFVIKQITNAKRSGFSVVILGDFNLSFFSFLDQQAVGRQNLAHYRLIEFLFERNYIDQHPLDARFKEYAIFYSQNSPTSRIDLIWYPDDFVREDFCFDQTWKSPCSYDLYPLDYNCVITYFTK